jgi:hypothetical protein
LGLPVKHLVKLCKDNQVCDRPWPPCLLQPTVHGSPLFSPQSTFDHSLHLDLAKGTTIIERAESSQPVTRLKRRQTCVDAKSANTKRKIRRLCGCSMRRLLRTEGRRDKSSWLSVSWVSPVAWMHLRIFHTLPISAPAPKKTGSLATQG